MGTCGFRVKRGFHADCCVGIKRLAQLSSSFADDPTGGLIADAGTALACHCDSLTLRHSLLI